jgi:hypothetical protein
MYRSVVLCAYSPGRLKPYKPSFGLWWLLWMALEMLSFFAVAHGCDF